MNCLWIICLRLFISISTIKESEKKWGKTSTYIREKEGNPKKIFIHIQKEEGVRGRGKKKGKLIIYGKNEAKCGWIYLGA